MFYGADPILFEFAKQNRINSTEAETVLWNNLSNKQLKSYRFKRQHPIYYFIADFYCHQLQLIIEVDGGYHSQPKQFQYDKERDYELNRLGINVLHFTNEEVLYDINKVLKTIEDYIDEYNRSSKYN